MISPTVIAILVALLSLLLILLYRRYKKPVPYLLVWIPYLLTVLPFVLSNYLPVGDSHTYYYPTFEYILDSVRQHHFFPQWFPVSGGLRIGIPHIPFLPFLPHRLLGYYLYSLLPVSTVIIYKLSYISGVLLMGYGWWLVLNRITGSRAAAYFGTLMIIMGGTGITFHQEQVLGITCYIPWFVYSILKIRDNPRFIFPASVLLGLGLTVYYPQIELISMGLFVLVVVIFSPAATKKLARACKRPVLPLAILLVLFILALLPALYLLNDIDNLDCDSREFSAHSYTDYLKMNQAGQSSAIWSYFYQYLKPTVQSAEVEGYGEMTDRCSFFVGRMALILGFLGIIFMPRKALPIIILLVSFSALTLGINSPVSIPRILFFFGLPTINVFREWVHFSYMINFCLSALAALGLAGLIKINRQKSGIRLYILIPIILFIEMADLTIYDLQYISEFREIEPEPPNKFSSRKNLGPTIVFQYKNRYDLSHTCPEAIPLEPYLTTNTINLAEAIEWETAETCSLLSCGEGWVVIDTPIKGILQPGRKIEILPDAVTVDSRGLNVSVVASEAALLVTPLNYDLGATAFLDNEEVPVKKVNSALAGVFVPKGTHRIEFKIPWDIYWPLVWIQWILYISLAVFFIITAQRERSRESRSS